MPRRVQNTNHPVASRARSNNRSNSKYNGALEASVTCVWLHCRVCVYISLVVCTHIARRRLFSSCGNELSLPWHHSEWFSKRNTTNRHCIFTSYDLIIFILECLTRLIAVLCLTTFTSNRCTNYHCIHHQQRTTKRVLLLSSRTPRTLHHFQKRRQPKWNHHGAILKVHPGVITVQVHPNGPHPRNPSNLHAEKPAVTLISHRTAAH